MVVNPSKICEKRLKTVNPIATGGRVSHCIMLSPYVIKCHQVKTRKFMYLARKCVRKINILHAQFQFTDAISVHF